MIMTNAVAAVLPVLRRVDEPWYCAQSACLFDETMSCTQEDMHSDRRPITLYKSASSRMCAPR